MKNINKKLKIPSKGIIGRCGHCDKLIYDKDKYEIIHYARPLVLEDKYKEGPIHKKCLLPTLKQFNFELMRDVETLREFLVKCN